MRTTSSSGLETNAASVVKEEALQTYCYLNGGKLRDTGHSSKAGPTAAVADEPKLDLITHQASMYIDYTHSSLGASLQ